MVSKTWYERNYFRIGIFSSLFWGTILGVILGWTFGSVKSPPDVHFHWVVKLVGIPGTIGCVCLLIYILVEGNMRHYMYACEFERVKTMQSTTIIVFLLTFLFFFLRT